MMNQELVKELEETEQFFRKTVSIFQESDSAFSPVPEMFTVAGQIAHVAITVRWFIEGTFLADQFDMNFEEHVAMATSCDSLLKALEMLSKAFDEAKKVVASQSDEQLMTPFPEGGLMRGPKSSVIAGIIDHTAHHRGALTVYARHLGRVAPMPYM